MVADGQSVYDSMCEKETEGTIPPAQGAPGNWREYNQALVQRGSLTLWVDEAALSGWQNQQKSGGRGASRTYSDSAIVCALTRQGVYHLPLRAIRPEGTRGCCGHGLS